MPLNTAEAITIFILYAIFLSVYGMFLHGMWVGKEYQKFKSGLLVLAAYALMTLLMVIQ